MNCAQARSLLDSGITPGSQTPERAQLGFHLSQCSSCRAYSADLESRLLAALLSAPASAPGAIADQPVLPPPPPDPRVRAVAPYARGRSLFPTRAVVAAFVVAGLLIMLLAVGPELLRVIHIHQNVQAMTSERLPAPSQSAVATAAPPTELPTATPRAATPTFLPSPTATLAPTATLVPTPAPRGSITIALLGIDQRPGETGGARSDAIIVVRIDPERRRVAMLSLPRDLYVDIPGYGYRRINSAMMYGRGDVAAGSAIARDALAQTLGTPIDYTMTIDFHAFIAAIDSIGGVTVNVDRELYDSKFPTMDYGYAKVHFLPGEQHFDGATALIYSRIRHPDSDFARMKRQQVVLSAVLGRFREQGLHENLAKLEAVTTALRDYVHTDLPEERLLGLAWALRDLEPAQIERYTLDQSLVTFGVGDDRWAEQAVDGAFEIVSHRLLEGDPEKKLR